MPNLPINHQSQGNGVLLCLHEALCAVDWVEYEALACTYHGRERISGADGAKQKRPREKATAVGAIEQAPEQAPRGNSWLLQWSGDTPLRPPWDVPWSMQSMTSASVSGAAPGTIKAQALASGRGIAGKQGLR